MPSWEEIQDRIFQGESGGDYNALFGYSNRPGKRYANVNLQNMTLDDVLKFTDPGGDYGQWVKGQIGRVATPVGGYQVVGSTLRDAVKGLGLPGTQLFNKATQDAIGQWILKTQGTGAWEGYRGAPVAGSVKPRRHVGGAGSGPQHFAGGEPASETPATTAEPLTPPVGEEKKPEPWNKTFGDAFAKFGEQKFDPININPMQAVGFESGQPMPSVYRPQLMPTQVQSGVGGMGGGQDMRQLLAMLMQGRGMG